MCVSRVGASTDNTFAKSSSVTILGALQEMTYFVEYVQDPSHTPKPRISNSMSMDDLHYFGWSIAYDFCNTLALLLGGSADLWDPEPPGIALTCLTHIRHFMNASLGVPRSPY